MSRLEVSAEVTVRCSAERAFDYFADHHHVAQVLEGVTRWEPVGAKASGVGARYNVELIALGVPLRSTLRINRWRRPHEIGWVSESGLIQQVGGFTFTEVPEGVRIRMHIRYQPPAWVIGAALARRLDGAVRARLERALERIREVLETAPN